MVRLAPTASVGMLQGKAVVQPPLLETKPSPGGVGSLTMTFVAVPGPLLYTWILKVAFVFGLAWPGPVLLMLRSATPAVDTGVTDTAVLLFMFESVEEVLAVAVFVMVEPL